MVYDKICPSCGTEFKTDRNTQTFCCHKCSNSGRILKERGNYDDSFAWTKTNGHYDCPYAFGVGCSVRQCNKCGWNPEVAQARMEAIIRKRKGECNV